MKPAFQAPAAFLNQIRAAIASEKTGLWWLGQSGFLLIQGGRGVLLDPYLSDSLTRKYAATDKPHVRMTERVVAPEELAELGVIDVISSSHNHTDHLDAETLQPLLASRTRPRLVIPAANRGFVLERLGAGVADQLVEVDEGGSIKVNEVEFHGIAAAHPTVERDEKGRCRFLGYVVRWSGLTVYHSGDTLWHEGLVKSLRRFEIDVALLPINGDRPERKVAGNLDGRQAANLANEVRANLVVPCHFDLFEFNTASPEDFLVECRRLGQPGLVLGNGEGFDPMARG